MSSTEDVKSDCKGNKPVYSRNCRGFSKLVQTGRNACVFYTLPVSPACKSKKIITELE